MHHLDGFKTFPQVIHLDLSCNQIKNIKLNINDYETLEVRQKKTISFENFDLFVSIRN